MGAERALYERDRHDGDVIAEVGTACIFVPADHVAVTRYSATVNMQGHDRVLFEILGGAAGATGDTIIISVQEATAEGAEGAVAAAGSRALASGAKITTLPATAGAGFATRNDLWLIEVRSEEMDVDNLFNFLQLKVVTTGTGWVVGAVAQRSIASYEPVATTNVTEVVP